MPDRIPYANLNDHVKITKDPRDEERDSFYSGKRWGRVRRHFLALNPLCERCKARGFVEAARIAHHKTERLESDPSSWYLLTSLEAICFSCHSSHHNERRKAK